MFNFTCEKSERGKYIETENGFGSVVACVWDEGEKRELEIHTNMCEVSFGAVENVLKLDGGYSCTVLWIY